MNFIKIFSNKLFYPFIDKYSFYFLKIKDFLFYFKLLITFIKISCSSCNNNCQMVDITYGVLDKLCKLHLLKSIKVIKF